MKDQLKETIISAIKKGEVTMRPRWHFVLRSALLLLGVIVTVLLLLFLSSFVAFMLRASGAAFVPHFGFLGLRSFIIAIPWLLILATLLFLVVLEILTRFYGFTRKIPLLYSALGVIVFVLLSTFIIGQTAFHERMSLRAMKGGLPIVGEIYRWSPELADVHRGRVLEITESGFILKHRRDATTSIIVSESTSLPYGDAFTEGDIVVVFGEKSRDVITAQGVIKVTEGMFDPSRPMNEMGGPRREGRGPR
jgi:hypothetical protein